MCENDPSPPALDNVWEISQHLSESDGLPFLLQIEDLQMSIDYPASHHNCCWTRAMLDPIWETFQKNCINLMEEEKEEIKTNTSLPDSSSSSCTSLLSKCTILTELSESIQVLFKRQRQERPPSSSVNRIRYIYRPPSVIRIGKGITGKLTIKFSLHLCDNSGKESTKLFPSFIAVEPVESIASFVTISVLEKRRRSSTCALALLPLQNINNENKVATYSSFDAELHFNTMPTTLLSSSSSSSSSAAAAAASLYKEPWAFRIYAAFYNSSQEQILLDEPFIHLCEWRPNVTQEERFAVMNPQMDPDVAFSTEKRHRATMQRHLKSAIERMDGVMTEVSTSSTPPIRSTLRHVATLQTLQSISMEVCMQSGNSTLASVMPRGIKWPLQLIIGDSSLKSWRPSPIPGSSSLDRLACEMKKLEEHLSEYGNDGDHDRIKKKKKCEDTSI
ncbi:uncharacterized protein TM35_000044010 [Trypanosoma theileri]|uniref:Uncharacterized protein n=1 Tax=Trypanosoma theileri TaxID=67003 RepID=A0A1X0P5I1_9TRYP|nr:uncharacterized protein TM35_000044010 [Trypanosoma theileri]ORC92187.1 hypothetical protein TM35_000044010 [Trypanosoma theileri]